MPSQNLSIKELADQLQQALDLARAEEERAVASEKKVAEMQGKVKVLEEKLKILEDMKKGAYQTVVTELFKKPSKKAFRLTVIVALFSIVVGLIQSLAFNWNADINQAKTVDRLAQSLKTQISEEIDKSKQFTAEQITRINQRGTE